MAERRDEMSSRKSSTVLYAMQTAALEGARLILEKVEGPEFVAQFFMGASVDIKKCREGLGKSRYPDSTRVLMGGFQVRLYNKCFEKRFAISIQVNQEINGGSFPIAGILIEDFYGPEKPFAQEDGTLYEFLKLKLGDPLKLIAVESNETHLEFIHG